ncbi:MAG TPA: hypothetical protein VN310_01125 [Candidatus Dormibacteraeota bacterium]|jgi:hypothetical protein|nr:hypothetical protein [Candidatus Dormibacteraeota bacterium]
MLRLANVTLPVLPLLCALSVAHGQVTDSGQAQNLPSASPIPSNAQRISKQTRYEIIRDFEAQLVYARTAFPMGTKGLRLKQGVITPNGEEMRQALSLWGPAIKPGDPAHISFVQIKDDHIHFEINGGPVHRKKWYQRLEVSGADGRPVTAAPSDPQANPHGSFVNIYFDKYVPEMTVQQVRELLYPVLDFNARNKEQAYLDTVPPKVKEAIQAHHVLVGMNQEMVLHAKGKPPRKVRERDGETQYEEWIYGDPPADVDFVRIVEDEVVRVETMRVGGEKIVRTEKEIVLPRPDRDKDNDKEAKKEPGERPAKAPSLRRPGEDSVDVPTPANGATPMPPPPPRGPDDKAPPPMPVPDGPEEFVKAR